MIDGGAGGGARLPQWECFAIPVYGITGCLLKLAQGYGPIVSPGGSGTYSLESAAPLETARQVTLRTCVLEGPGRGEPWGQGEGRWWGGIKYTWCIGVTERYTIRKRFREFKVNP